MQKRLQPDCGGQNGTSGPVERTTEDPEAYQARVLQRLGIFFGGERREATQYPDAPEPAGGVLRAGDYYARTRQRWTGVLLSPEFVQHLSPEARQQLIAEREKLGHQRSSRGLSLEEEDLLALALDMLLDEPEGQRAMLQICVDEEDARAVLPVWKNQYVLPLMADVSKQPYQLLFPVPVYTAKGKPWKGLPDLQACFERLLEKYRQESKRATPPQQRGKKK